MSALALTETARLAELEAVVERGLTTFVEVGQALLEIRESRLYRATYGTFEDYCAERWQFTDRRARQLIQAAEIGTVVPVANERQARELTPLAAEPERVRETWAEVVALHPEPTAEDVRAVVNRSTVAALTSSESFEWYTPARYVDRARECMGGIDLDPASCLVANRIVGAAKFYSAEDNGLSREWFGRVWLNPPYGRLCPRFVVKLTEEYDAGRVDEAILLVNAYSTETAWFQPLLRRRVVCFADRRINFLSPSCRGGNATFGSAFFYFGARPERFAHTFRDLGVTMAPFEVAA